ncbi:hypothetical protein [Streptomyces bluensis]|uniref:hypothetical protein n=1 Tax=Streptomyces bluensis TaxID=33897 RepID=UPI00331DF70B
MPDSPAADVQVHGPGLAAVGEDRSREALQGTATDSEVVDLRDALTRTQAVRGEP